MSNDIHTPRRPEIWRDGDRIASDLCGGFWDRVPDADLERYASEATSHELDRSFAAAVLAIRNFERLALEERLVRAHRVSA